jgi:diguanylate cyclase (GGDEF)-like protein
MKTPVWVFDTDNSSIAYANAAGVDVWQAESEEALRARDLGAGMSATVAKRLKQYQLDFSTNDAHFSEFWTIYPNGVPRTLKVVYTGFTMPDGRMAMMCEALGEAEDEPETLRSAEALLHTDVMITLYGIDGQPLYMNPASRNAAPAQFGRFQELFALSTDYAIINRELESQEQYRRVAQVRTANGTRWFDLSVKRCLDAATGDKALLVTAVDVTELKTARDQANYLANRDQLTGCYNRAFVQQHLQELRETSLDLEQHHVLIALDIDGFKLINDTFGHEVGDDILIEFASRIQHHLRGSDIVARMGGDEFLVILKEFDGGSQLNNRLADICREVRRPIASGALQLNITTSIGASVAQLSSVGDWSNVIKQADIALYHSKRKGRDCYTVFNEALGAEVIERRWMETELKKAVENNAFTVHYQPRYDTHSGRMVSAEALIRWNHPERGFIPPDDFIPLCEEMGFIDRIGDFVCRRACAQLNAWHAAGMNIGLSVNVSPKQFQSPDIVSLFEEIAREAEFPKGMLELEITETSLFGDDAHVTQKLQRITELGFRIALDDFGAGYSNLAHISRLPLHCVKLDKSFVQKLPTSGPLLRLIFALAEQIGATTVAEGVELPEQLEWLKQHDCNQVQGFLLSEPVPAGEINQLAQSISLSSLAA